MSILIRGMEMPCACVFCELYDGDLYWCRGAKREVPYSPEDKCAEFCPLVHVPEHGRLIDADALCNRLEKAGKIKPYLESGLNVAISFSLTAPTIIQASEEGER